MRGDDQTSRLLHELSALLLTVLRAPPPPQGAARRRRPRVSPAGIAALLLGISTALMLCGSLTFAIGFMLMPWVLGLGVMLCFAGVVSSLSGLGRAILCPAASPSPSPKEAQDLFSKLPID